jgi:Fic family protein
MFHRLAVSGIYPCAGHYRTADLDVAITGTAHRIPSPSRVPYLVTDLVDQLNRDRVDGVPGVDRAAYALWRLAWIHPFAGGNGRTARALAYLVLCMDLQTVLPGLPQLPTRLYQRDAEVLAALQAGDAGETSGQGPDLQPMRALLQDIIAQQLESAKRD